jgi:hypothetical protein
MTPFCPKFQSYFNKIKMPDSLEEIEPLLLLFLNHQKRRVKFIGRSFKIWGMTQV